MDDTRLRTFADGLEAALGDGANSFRNFTATIFAETVNFLHEPPQPNDASLSRADLIAHEERIDAAIRRALPDSRYGDIEVSVVDGAVRSRYTLTGHRPDGTEVSVPLGHTYRFSDAGVDEYVVVVSTADADRLKALLTADPV